MTDPALVDFLLAARRSGSFARCPPEARPADAAAADAIQDLVASRLVPTDGPIVGWKVGAPSPDAEPSAAPLHAATVFAGPPGPARHGLRLVGAEAELAYRFDRAPSIRNGVCSPDAVAEAIGAVHVAIEILDTRFEAIPDDALLARADQANHGALIVGPGRRDWRRIVPLETRVTLSLDRRAAVSHHGGNRAGDPLRLLAWLAGHAARRGWPLHAGIVVTTGSTTGTVFVDPEVSIEASFEGLGALALP